MTMATRVFSAASLTSRPRKTLGPQQLFSWLLVLVTALLLYVPYIPLAQALALSSSVQDSYLSPSELDACYKALDQADSNNDSQVDRDEYTAFALGLLPSADNNSSSSLTNVSEYSQLPLSLQAAFLSTACLCGNDANDFATATWTTTTSACCMGTLAHMDVPEQGPLSSTISTQDLAYLYAVCSITTSAVQAEYYWRPTPPSASSTKPPTLAPVRLTLYPTATPVDDDLVSPTTSPAPSSVDASATAVPTTTHSTVFVKTSVPYEIAVPASVDANATARADYLAELQVAMDQLAQAVVVSVSVDEPVDENNNVRQRRMRRLGSSSNMEQRQSLQRRLQVVVQLPTSFGDISYKGTRVFRELLGAWQ